jgi:hypothetical protein
MKSLEDRIRAAQNARAEALWECVRDPHPEVVSNTTLNRNLTEDMALFIAKSRKAPSEALGFLAGDVRFKESYKLKLALCKNPRTPQRVALSLLKFLRIFDLAVLTRDQQIPTILRQKIEQALSEKIRAMPLGVKTALAKKANSAIVMGLMEKGDARVVTVCLESPVLTEGDLYKIINRTSTGAVVIKMIAEHPKWSLRYQIRFALIRNFFTPTTLVVRFIGGMKTVDLKELYDDARTPLSTKPFLFRELLERGESTEVAKEEIYDLPEDEGCALDDET